MVQVVVNGKQYYMDGYLKSNLDTAKEVIKDDWDMVIGVDGVEGGGKSALTQQMASYVDHTFNIDRVCFTPEEFLEAIKKAQQYQAVVFDEGYTGLSSRSTMSEVNRIIVQCLAEIRQKNLFIFIVLPTFFDLDKYVALWRSRALVHIYTGDGFQRGYFAFFNRDKKKELYIAGKKTYSYAYPRANFTGRFSKGYMVDEVAYRQKKLESLGSKEIGKGKAVDEKGFQRWLMKKFLESNVKVTNIDKARLLGVSEQTYYRWIESYSNNGIPKEIG